MRKATYTTIIQAILKNEKMQFYSDQSFKAGLFIIKKFNLYIFKLSSLRISPKTSSCQVTKFKMHYNVLQGEGAG